MNNVSSVKKWHESFYYFVIAAFLGFVYEFLLINFYYNIPFVNAGPFHLPLLLIYGVGGAFVIMLLKDFRKKKIKILKINITPIVIALIILLIVCVVEYFGHWAVETFAGVKPWDYSDKFMNLNGRICLEDSLRFVILGLVGIYAVVPLSEKLFKKLTPKQNNVLFTILFSTICIDLLIWIVFKYIV